MNQAFFYVYILISEVDESHYYVGFTTNLNKRLAEHNAGKANYTSKHRPWRVKTAVAFTDETRALAFERYLKSPSGRAFAKKRL